MPDSFSDFEILLTVAVNIQGDKFDPSQWDDDEEAFRAEITKEAREGMRNNAHDIGDCWVESVEPPL